MTYIGLMAVGFCLMIVFAFVKQPLLILPTLTLAYGVHLCRRRGINNDRTYQRQRIIGMGIIAVSFMAGLGLLSYALMSPEERDRLREQSEEKVAGQSQAQEGYDALKTLKSGTYTAEVVKPAARPPTMELNTAKANDDTITLYFLDDLARRPDLAAEDFTPFTISASDSTYRLVRR
jgi:hypothetical protein